MSRLLSKFIFITLLLVLRGMPVFADNAEDLLQTNGDDMEALYGDEEFVSIATGAKKPIYKAPAVASVITADQIKEMGATTLDQVLERVPGLHVSLSTQGRLDSVYSIRGIHTKFNPQVLVLVNGFSFPHYGGGRTFQFRMPVAAISRIEVLRGPGSAVYGADAYAGVINIITKDANEIGGTEVGARTGSFNTQDVWLQHGGTYGDWDVAFSLEWQKTDGDKDRRVNADLQTIFDAMNGTSVSRAPGPLDTRYDVIDTHLEVSNDTWKLRYWFWRQDDAGMGAGGALSLDPVGGESYNQHLVDLTYNSKDLLANWNLSVNVNYLYKEGKSHLVLFPPGSVLHIGADGNLGSSGDPLVTFSDGYLGNPDANHDRLGLDLVADTAWSTHHWRLATGTNQTRSWVVSETKNFGPGVIDGSVAPIDGTLTDVANTSNVFLADSSRTAWYLSAQDEWQVAPDWELTTGLRYDHYSDFGATLNPRVALVWETRYNLTSKLLYGHAFRAPTFTELYSKNNPVALGNPDLKPETINTIELAFDYRPIFNWQTNLSLFTYRAEDLIEFVSTGGGTKTAENARDQEGYGFEFEVIWDATETLRLSGNYAWQHSEDADTGQRIGDAPGQQLMLNADWKFYPNWSLYSQMNWVASRKRPAGDTRPAIDNYALVDLTLRRKNILGGWELSAAVRNLFDEDAREPSPSVNPDDFPLEGRCVWVELSYRFGS